MSKTALLRKYELVVILDARFATEEKESLFKSITDTVAKSGAKVINASVWMERHKMTFKINKCQEGTYYVVNFEGDPQTTHGIRASLRLNEKILRYLIINVE
jgi:small subunit ribosomal protein S6